MIAKKVFSVALAIALGFGSAFAQEQKYSKEQILSMTIEELSDLPLEDLMAAVETLGVSSVDELFAMIMNKNVASASKKEESSFTSPLSSTTITREEMRMYGVTTIEEAFRLIPGMFVQEKTNGNYDVVIRGMNNIPDGQRLIYSENPNMLVMVDGRMINNNVAGAVFFESLPIGIEDIQRIEVVRGATSALYGANAVQGVINIITEKPDQALSQVSGSLQVGNLGTAIGDIGLRKRVNDKLALGATFNMQLRERNTDKLYVMPVMENSDAGDVVLLDEGWYTLDQIQDMSIYAFALQKECSLVEPETPIHKMFPNPRLARKNWGVNGYVTFNPTPDIRFDLTGGYQQADIISATIDDDYFSQGGRGSKTGYLNFNANIHGLHAQYSHMQGPTTYVEGVPGYKTKTILNEAWLDYDWQITDNFSVRPGVYYQSLKTDDPAPGEWIDYEPVEQKGIDPVSGVEYTVMIPNTAANGDPIAYSGYKYPGTAYPVSSFFKDGGVQVHTVAPSIQLDYRLDGWRFIGAYRADKTSVPDRWNHSWQVAVSKEINDKNFVRVSYARASRGAALLNSSSDYSWERTNLTLPNRIRLTGNEDIDLMHTDAVELGYRLRPTGNLLIDAELYYSRATDFCSFRSKSSQFYLSSGSLQSFMVNLFMGAVTGTLDKYTDPKYLMNDVFSVQSEIQVANHPFVAQQFGLSANVDWIISSKLMAKFNINVQNTLIDNYYKYDQNAEIRRQIGMCSQNITEIIQCYLNDNVSTGRYVKNENGEMVREYEKVPGSSVISAFMQSGGNSAAAFKYMSDMAHYVGVTDVLKVTESKDEIMRLGRAALDGYINGSENPELAKLGIKQEDYLATFYSLTYGVMLDRSKNEFYFANTDTYEQERKDGFKHKATPTVYGMVGLVYKPINALTVSAFANFMGKRTYETKYMTEELDPRFTVNLKLGYKPMDNIEVFFNAHNLFNSEKREFTLMDKIGGLYTFGVNFKF